MLPTNRFCGAVPHDSERICQSAGCDNDAEFCAECLMMFCDSHPCDCREPEPEPDEELQEEDPPCNCIGNGDIVDATYCEAHGVNSQKSEQAYELSDEPIGF